MESPLSAQSKFIRSLRIFVADDHDLIRRGVKTLLESHGDWEVCGEARTGIEAISRAEKLKPDVVILDISMPELNGLESAKQIRKVSPGTEVLILSAHSSDQLVREILEAGARGYVMKSDSGRDLIIAVEALARHEPFFTPGVTQIILNDMGGKRLEGTQTTHGRLTSRERQIVQLVAEGNGSKEVACSLNISVKTVETHRANVMRKLELRSVADLVRYAVRNQIIEP